MRLVSGDVYIPRGLVLMRFFYQLRDDGVHAIRMSPRHQEPQSFPAQFQPPMGTSQESCRSVGHDRDCSDCGDQSVRSGLRESVHDKTYTRDVLGPSVRFWTGNSDHGRSAQADCEDISQGKYHQPRHRCLLILMANRDCTVNHCEDGLVTNVDFQLWFAFGSGHATA